MSWVFVGIMALAVVELFFRLPFASTLSTFGSSPRKAVAVIGSKRISDHWKEQAIIRYAWRIFVSSFRICVLMVASFTPFLALFGVDAALDGGIFEFTMSVTGLVYTFAVSGVYLLLRERVIGRLRRRFKASP